MFARGGQRTIGRALLAGLAMVVGIGQSTGPDATLGRLSSAAAMSFGSFCELPAGSVKRSGSATRFTLRHGDVGGCRTDARARHGAPYWERAELQSGHLRSGRTYDISFDVRFDPGTRSSNRTTFFQIHTASSACLACYPALMLKVHADGRVAASVLSTPDRHVDRGLGVSRGTLATGWNRIRVVAGIEPGRKNDLRVFIGGRPALATEMLVPARGQAFLKYGLYRPGDAGGLPTDSVTFRNVRVDAR
jgi:hypothetical protein